MVRVLTVELVREDEQIDTKEEQETHNVLTVGLYVAANWFNQLNKLGGTCCHLVARMVIV